MSDPNLLLHTLYAERAKHPAKINGEQANAILNAVAWKHRGSGWGLLRKTSGNEFDDCAVDILANRFTGLHYDVFIDGPDETVPVLGRAEVTMGEQGPFDLTRWVPAREQEPSVPTPPPPPVEPPTPPPAEPPAPPPAEPPPTPPVRKRWWEVVPWGTIAEVVGSLLLSRKKK